MQAHEDFILTCGRGYFLAYVLKYFHKDNLDSKPVHPAIIESISDCINSKKKESLCKILDEVMADVLIKFHTIQFKGKF